MTSTVYEVAAYASLTLLLTLWLLLILCLAFYARRLFREDARYTAKNTAYADYKAV